MHSKVQNFTKKEKSPTPLDQTVDKTLYEVELQNMSADKSMSFSNIKPLSKGIKRQCDGSQKTEQIPTERIAICKNVY